jgi:hypothetical protein
VRSRISFELFIVNKRHVLSCLPFYIPSLAAYPRIRLVTIFTVQEGLKPEERDTFG